MTTDAMQTLLPRATAYAARNGLKLATISRYILQDRRRLAAIASGKSFLRPPTLAAALERMTALEAAEAAKAAARATGSPQQPISGA